MNLRLGQSTVKLFLVPCGEYKVGGFDVFLKILTLPVPGIGTMNGFLASNHASDSCAVVAPFPFR